MNKYRYNDLLIIIDQKVTSGEWVVDSEAGTLTTKRGVLKGANSKGYICSTAKLGGKLVHFTVHEVIALYNGINLVDKVINHIDFDTMNNSISNLEAVTQVENLQHAHRHGKMSNKKLNKDQVMEIKVLLMEGTLNMVEISKLYNVTQPTIQSIKHGRTHKDVIIQC